MQIFHIANANINFYINIDITRRIRMTPLVTQTSRFKIKKFLMASFSFFLIKLCSELTNYVVESSAPKTNKLISKKL